MEVVEEGSLENVGNKEVTSRFPFSAGGLRIYEPLFPFQEGSCPGRWGYNIFQTAGLVSSDQKYGASQVHVGTEPGLNPSLSWVPLGRAFEALWELILLSLCVLFSKMRIRKIHLCLLHRDTDKTKQQSALNCRSEEITVSPLHTNEFRSETAFVSPTRLA